MRWIVADTLSGKIIGQLEPSTWDITDPLRTPGTGTLSIALPRDSEKVARLVDLTTPRIRWVAQVDDDGTFLFAGPIPRTPGRDGGTITVSLQDWRSWYYRAPYRPAADGSRRTYVAKGREQTTILRELALAALDTDGAPRMVVDSPLTTHKPRDLTVQMLDRSVGEAMDSLVAQDGAPEWWTYAGYDPTDETLLLPHVGIAWPERKSRDVPIRLEYKVGIGGNVSDYTWPEGQDASTRVWALGTGEPPDQVWAVDEYPELSDGTEVAWESILGPLDGVSKRSTAFDHAFSAVQRSRGFDGTADFTVTGERLPLSSVFPGDRARVILDDGWDVADVAAGRITQRVMSGGRGRATTQTLTVDLADDGYPDDGSDPGEAITN